MTNDSFKTINAKDLGLPKDALIRVTLHYDPDAECPVEKFTLKDIPAVSFVTFERNSTLADMHPWSTPEDMFDFLSDTAATRPFAVFPLYKYEHSGSAYAITPFSCPWDSGRTGVVLVDPVQIGAAREADGGLGVNDPRCAEQAALFTDIVTRWCGGEFVGFLVETATPDDPDEWEVQDSCWGIDCPQYAEDVARDAAVHHYTHNLADTHEAAGIDAHTD